MLPLQSQSDVKINSNGKPFNAKVFNYCQVEGRPRDRAFWAARAASPWHPEQRPRLRARLAAAHLPREAFPVRHGYCIHRRTCGGPKAHYSAS